MKLKISTLTILLLILVSVTAMAQKCNLYIPDKEGAVLERTFYDTKDKETSKQILTVKKVSNTNEGLKIDVNSLTTQKDIEPSEVDYTMWCKDGKFFVDMKQFVSKEQVSSFQNTTVEATEMDYPAEMNVGQTLVDGKITISMVQEGMPMPIKTTIDILNRRITAQEDITTAAGTFSCYKIEYDLQIKIMMKIQIKAAEWIAQDIGTVKSESYNKKGKLTGYSLLTQIK